MKGKSQSSSSKRRSGSLFARLLTIWVEYRRVILLVLISASLISFISTLSVETRLSMVRGLFARRSLVVLLLSFTLLVLSLLLSAGQRLDTWIFLLLNLRGFHPLWLDRVMWAFTQIGNGIAGIFLGIFLFYAGQRQLAIKLLFGIMSLWLIVELLKALIERSRPFIALEGTRVIGWRERGLSFPSGHTSQAFLMATLISHHFALGPMLSSLLYGIALIVGYTRIYVGAHYPRDVIGGAILGSVWGILAGMIEIYLTSRMF